MSNVQSNDDMVLKKANSKTPSRPSSPKPAVEQQPLSSSENKDLPEFPVRKRKCRDVYCWILFILFYGALIFWFCFNKYWTFYENAFDMIQPGDDMRRLCGSKKQHDKRAADFARFLTKIEDIQSFCTFVKGKYPDLKITTDCTSKVGIEFRKFFKDLKDQEFMADVSNENASFAVGNNSVCVRYEQIAAIPDKKLACNAPNNASYVCHKEFVLFAAKNIVDFDTQIQSLPNSINLGDIETKEKAQLKSFFTKDEYDAILKVGNLNLLKNFCFDIGSYPDADPPRGDQMNHPVTIFFGYDTCISDPTFANKYLNQSVAYLTTYFENLLTNMVFEIKIHWVWIVVGCSSSILVAVLYLIVMQYFIKFLVWVIIIGIIFGLLIVGGYLLYMGYELQQLNNLWLEYFGYENKEYSKYIKMYLGFGYTAIIVDAILLLLIFIFCRAINIACEVIKLAIESLKKIWFVFLLPIIFIIIMVFHVVWTSVIAYFYYLSGEYDEQLNQFDFVKIKYDNDYFIQEETDHLNLTLFILTIFGVIWGLFFVYAWVEFTISHIVVQWYFNRKRDKHHFCDAACNAFKAFLKSFGTILFASFITSLVVLARWLLEYFMKRLKQTPGASQNKLITTLHKCGSCCLKYLQKYVEFINRNAQIYACVSGEGYCKSVFSAIKLLFGEVRATIALQGLSAVILFLGKVLVSGVATVITFLLTSKFGKVPHAVFTPCVVTALGSFLFAYYVMEIIELIIDTIYFCFLYEQDALSRDREKGAESYAPPSLAALLS